MWFQCNQLHVLFQSNWDIVTDNFDDMKLREELLRGIYAYGFEKPSAIQQRAIVPCLHNHDVIAQAQSGTGKTATFAISILQQIDVSLKKTQALVLAPTRELAQQVCFCICGEMLKGVYEFKFCNHVLYLKLLVLSQVNRGGLVIILLLNLTTCKLLKPFLKAPHMFAVTRAAVKRKQRNVHVLGWGGVLILWLNTSIRYDTNNC